MTTRNDTLREVLALCDRLAAGHRRDADKAFIEHMTEGHPLAVCDAAKERAAAVNGVADAVRAMMEPAGSLAGMPASDVDALFAPVVRDTRPCDLCDRTSEGEVCAGCDGAGEVPT